MSYKKFDEADLAFLRSLCGDERVTERGAVGEDYCHDELGGAFARPDARVQVLSVDEISRVMRYAFEHGRTLFECMKVVGILVRDKYLAAIGVPPSALDDPPATTSHSD